MSDFAQDAREGDARRLAQALRLATGVPDPWLPEELAAVLHQQLMAPMPLDLGALEPEVAAHLRTVADSSGLLVKSLGDLIQHEQPPLELLRMTKDFAKAHLDHPESPLPREVASVLYYTAIAAALVRRNERISGLDDPHLRQGIEWALAQPWLETPVVLLLQLAFRRLAP